MKFKKALCGITAALTVFSSVAVVAQAEEAEQLKLLTAEFSEANGAHSLKAYGDGYFAPGAEEDDKSKFFHIGEKELAEWRETGKFTFTNVESELDTNGMDWWSGSFEGEYIQFFKQDGDGNVTERQVVHLDKTNDKITTVYKLGADWHYTTIDGYSIAITPSGSDMKVDIYDPSGKKTSKTITGKVEDFWYNGYGCQSGDNNVGYVIMETDNKPGTEDFPYESGTFEVYAVKKDGTLELIFKDDESYGFGCGGSGSNCVMFANQPAAMALQYKIYSTESKKIYDLGDTLFYGNFGDSGFYNMMPKKLYGDLYGTKAVIGGEIGPDDVRYSLVDLDTAELVSKQYKSMSTKDGKIYLVQTVDDKWGYIDSNGKELGVFDDAGIFYGDYAPVVKDDKAYLIDRNMNKVSESIDGTSVTTLSDGLYRVAIDDAAKFVTYANNSDDEPTIEPSSEPTSEPSSEPTSEPSSEPTSEPTSETSSDPVSSEPTSEPSSESSTAKPADDGEKPAPTGAAALIPVALIGVAAVVVSSKKRRK